LALPLFGNATAKHRKDCKNKKFDWLPNVSGKRSNFLSAQFLMKKVSCSVKKVIGCRQTKPVISIPSLHSERFLWYVVFDIYPYKRSRETLGTVAGETTFFLSEIVETTYACF
jgi:hypothetical protein